MLHFISMPAVLGGKRCYFISDSEILTERFFTLMGNHEMSL